MGRANDDDLVDEEEIGDLLSSPVDIMPISGGDRIPFLIGDCVATLESSPISASPNRPTSSSIQSPLRVSILAFPSPLFSPLDSMLFICSIISLKDGSKVCFACGSLGGEMVVNCDSGEFSRVLCAKICLLATLRACQLPLNIVLFKILTTSSSDSSSSSI